MCGIFAYVGKSNGIPVALAGLKKVEYRGYDSSGIAYINNNTITRIRATGKLNNLEQKISHENSSCVIAHTRWATHGGVTEENAHPITDSTGAIAVIHNGIVENHNELRRELMKKGHAFYTQTDTEVIPNIIASFYKGDLLQAVQQAVTVLKGAWAIVVIHKDHPNECIVAKNSSPLVIGLGTDASFVASDANAFITHTRHVIYLEEGELARVTADGIELFDQCNTPISKEAEILVHTIEEHSKGSFEHYTLKEIFEQPQTVRNAMSSRYCAEYGSATFNELTISSVDLAAIRRIVIVGAGTSYHAGLVAAYMLEELARIPTTVEIASELRYKNPILEEKTLVIAISQSGETADTIAAVRELRAKGATVLALCNAQGSTLAREADSTLLLHAGQEIGVCSTKAFTSQLTVLALLTLLMGRLRHLTKEQGQAFLAELASVPSHIEAVIAQATYIEELAKRYAHTTDFFFIGRRYMFPTALECALKLKEIAYVNANGYSAGELKHGPIALLSSNHPTFALCTDQHTYEKVVSNVMEAKARLSPIIAVTFYDDVHLKALADCVAIPRISDFFAPITSTVVGQLFAYFSAKHRGTDIDQPKNLAKSVTVE